MPHKTRVALAVATVFLFATLIAITFDRIGGERSKEGDTGKSMTTIITAETISTPDELADALKHDALIVHFDVDWSVYAIQSRSVIAKFRKLIEGDSGYRDVVFRRIDCTEQDGAVWNSVAKWLQEQDADMSLMSTGYGAVAWVRSGNVVGAVHYAADEGLDKLVTKTQSIMRVRKANP